MPKAEVGSTKHLANQMKAKGLGRLRWYCEVCRKQCRDENGFKQHYMSESHNRAIRLVEENPNKYIHEYSRQFQQAFLGLLKTSHGEKRVNLNQFYQEYIRDKGHIHMNATRWPSLTEFGKYLGREALCRVWEEERGLEIAYIDDSPETVRRREEIRKMEGRVKGDEEWEARLLGDQIKRAREAERDKSKGLTRDEDLEAERWSGIGKPVKVSLSLKGKAPAPAVQTEMEREAQGDTPAISSPSPSHEEAIQEKREAGESGDEIAPSPKPAAPPAQVSISLAAKAKTANPLVQRNPLSKKREAAAPRPEKKISNAERIMKEEMERKRLADERGSDGAKRRRFG